MSAPEWREPQRRCLRLEDWPAADRESWQEAVGAGRLLADDGPGAALRPVTLKRHRASYGRWLGFLTRQGWLDPAEEPGMRATAERIRGYVGELQELNAPGTVLVRLQSLAVVLGWLAPDLDWSWLRPIIQRLAARVRPCRAAGYPWRGSEELIALGHRLMAQAEQGSAPEDGGRRYPVEVKRAMRYRDGLMVALLAHHPLRLANLAGLQLGHELRDDGSGWWLELEPAAIKNRRPYLVPLARDLIPPLDRYLRYWRPRLAGPAAAAQPDALWLSGEGGALGTNHVRHRICRHTEIAFGKPVNPHLFRDAIATTIAVRRPELVGIVTPLLGHRSVVTAQRHYNRAGMTSAADKWHDVLDRLSRE